MSLQYGVPLEDYVRKFSHMRFEPQGYTKNPDIRIAKSLIDYIFRWLGITFLPGYKEASLGVLPAAEPTAESSAEDSADSQSDASASTRSQVSGDGFQEKAVKPRPPVAEKPGPKVERDKRKGANGTIATLAHPTPDTRHPAPSVTNGHTNGKGNGRPVDVSTALLARAGVMVKGAEGPNTARSEQFADFQSDAPACDNCGAITVRNGNCYLCHNCGSSMGCS
jgi:ribonucleoside-diphosphate reductase alpha chain